MFFFDLNGVKKEVIYIKIIHNLHIEVKVKHPMGQVPWIEWYTIEEFKEKNPHINLNNGGMYDKKS
jgi:hypothetical protein